MTIVERTASGLRVRHACPVGVDALSTVVRDGRWFVLSAGDGAVRWWDVELGPEHGITFEPPDSAHVTSLALAQLSGGVGIVVGLARFRGLRRWDLASGLPVDPAIDDPSLRGFGLVPGAPPMVVAEGGDGPVVVTGGRDGELQRWDILHGVRVGNPWAGHEGGVWSLAVVDHPDGLPVVVSGGADGLVRCWDPRAGVAYGPAIEKCGRAVAIEPAPLSDGRVILCIASAQGNIHRRDLVTGAAIGPRISTGWQPRRPKRVCRAHLAYVAMPPGGIIASCVDDHTVQLWDLMTGQPAAEPIRDAGSWITAMASARRPDGTPLVVVGDNDGTVRRFDPRTGALIGEPVQPHGVSATRIATFTIPGDEIVLAVATRDRLRCFNARTGQPVGDPWRPLATTASGLATAHLPDGRTLLIAGGEGGIRRVDLTTGEALPAIPDEETIFEIWDLATVSLPDGRMLIAGAGDAVYRWNATTGAAIGPPLTGHRDIVRSVAAASRPDGTTIIISGDDSGQIRRWDAVTGAAIGAPLPGLSGVDSLAVIVFADGRHRLLGVDSSAGLHQWDPFTGKTVRPMIAIPRDAYLIATHIDRDDIPTVFFQVTDDTGSHHIERWRLDLGTLLDDTLPTTLRTVYNDGDKAMMVLSEPDGSLTIEPLTQPDRR